MISKYMTNWLEGSPVSNSITEAVQRDLTATVKEINKMSKPATTSDAVKSLKALIAGESDKLKAKTDQIATRAAEAFAIGNQIVDAEKADLDAMEAELRQLSNLQGS